MLEYMVSELLPKFIPQKMGLLYFETLQTFTFDGAFV